jgi:hypothetical protein
MALPLPVQRRLEAHQLQRFYISHNRTFASPDTADNADEWNARNGTFRCAFG